MRILIVSSIDPLATEHLSRDHVVTCAFGAGPDELQEKIREADILIFRSGVSVSTEVLEAAPELRLIVRAGSGLDNIDLQELHRRGIPLVRIPRPSAQAVAELTLAHMLGLARNLVRADSLWRDGQWVKNDLESYLINGKTLGIVGVGNIGQRMGEIGVALGMNVVGCVERWTKEEANRLAQYDIELLPLDEMVPRADFLTIHVPLTDDTRHMIDAEFLGRMKPGSWLVNMARGGVVDEAALRNALVSGNRLRGAALDVHENEGPGRLSPLRNLPNVILTPHIGASTVDTQREIGREIIEIVEKFVAETQTEELMASKTDVEAEES